MNLPLKYSVPLGVFLTGAIMMAINIFFYAKSEHEFQMERAKEHSLLIGNRIVNDIEKRGLYDREHHAELIRILSQYSLEYLDTIKIFDEKNSVIFDSVPVRRGITFSSREKDVVTWVVQEHKARVCLHQQEMNIDAVLPLAMRPKPGEVYSKEFGALYLRFGMHEIHEAIMERVIRHAITNGLIILLMIAVLGVMIYFLVLKRLGLLHAAAMKMAEGDFDFRIESRQSDELAEVKHAFNDMAGRIKSHQAQLQQKIDEAIRKNDEQNQVLFHQGRLVAMGEMINNIAHQWRQPLNALGLVLQKMEVYRRRGNLDDALIKESIDKSMNMIDKMSITIDDFRNFFTQDKEPKLFGFKKTIEEVMILVEGVLQQNDVAVILDVEESSRILGHKNEFMQVLVNLINNAKDALVEHVSSNRKIVIGCSATEDSVVLSVKDNAGGIPKDLLERIFDPYFTTKPAGKGTGIGLYMSKTIIEDHMGGSLKVRNDDEGAVFEIFFPVDTVSPSCRLKPEKADKQAKLQKGSYED